MKKIVLSAIAISFVFIACNSNSEKTKATTSKETMTTDTSTKPATMNPAAEQLYACPMHAEVIGKKDEECSKCRMKLTVPVKNSETPK